MANTGLSHRQVVRTGASAAITGCQRCAAAALVSPAHGGGRTRAGLAPPPTWDAGCCCCDAQASLPISEDREAPARGYHREEHRGRCKGLRRTIHDKDHRGGGGFFRVATSTPRCKQDNR